MKKVFVAGGVSYNNVIQLDEFPEPVGKTYHKCIYSEGVGSTGAGKSLNLSKLGFSVTLHSLLGDDEYKAKVLKVLEGEGIRVIHNIDKSGTERHVNILNKLGQRISIFTNPVSDDPEVDLGLIEKSLLQADYAVINIYNYCKKILPLCEKNAVPVWTDLHDYNGGQYYEEFIAASDYIFMSDEYIPDPLWVLQSFIDRGKSLAVCTRAHRGAIAMNSAGEVVQVPAKEHYQNINSNGAGDAFFSGFLYAYNLGVDLTSCMEAGSHAAGLCVESMGLMNPLLSPEAILLRH